MAHVDERARRTLETVDRVHSLLSAQGIDCALIGAMACAVHRYSRATEDVDLAVYADPVQTLPAFARLLADSGFQVEFERPFVAYDACTTRIITAFVPPQKPARLLDVKSSSATKDGFRGWRISRIEMRTSEYSG